MYDLTPSCLYGLNSILFVSLCCELLFCSSEALTRNQAMEMERNRERFVFLKWGAKAFKNMLIVPPGCGIVHQVCVCVCVVLCVLYCYVICMCMECCRYPLRQSVLR